MNNVPCNGCKRCCIGDAVRLMPEEVGRFFKEPHPRFKDSFMLAHKANDECIYLGDRCMIHDDKPLQCQTMDCRNIARLSYTQIRKSHCPIPVWKKGRELARIS
jgi:hypothetical protein